MSRAASAVAIVVLPALGSPVNQIVAPDRSPIHHHAVGELGSQLSAELDRHVSDLCVEVSWPGRDQR